MAKRVLGGLFCLFCLFSMLLRAADVQAQDDLLKERSDQYMSTKEPALEMERQKPKDHWTPYFPPDVGTFSPDLKVHVIVQGDTLWGIAQIYLGDGLLWPQIWEVNKYITDAHWIYPGDPVIIPQPLLIAEIEEEPVPEETGEILRQAKPQPIASVADVNCSFYYVQEERKKKRAPDELAAIPQIIGSEEPKISFSVGDVVYINIGEQSGVIPGDEYFIVRDGDLVYHPASMEVVGRQVDMVGKLVVLAAQEQTSTARIDEACDSASVGHKLRPYSQIPIPLASGYMHTSRYWTKSSGKKQGYIISTKDNIVAAATGNLVGIDIGSNDGIVPGDFLTVFKPNPLGERFPRTILGDVVVLMVSDETATSKIVNAYDSISAGDQVELK